MLKVTKPNPLEVLSVGSRMIRQADTLPCAPKKSCSSWSVVLYERLAIYRFVPGGRSPALKVRS